MAEIQLQAQALSCIRGEKLLWSNIQFQLAKGQLLQVVGENGCGKSSFLKILAGLARSDSGSVLWQNKCIQENLLAYQSQIHYVGHQIAVKNAMSVKENIASVNIKKKITESQMEFAIEQLGLSSYLYHYGYQLSQGQKQRLALARLLLTEMPLWILDEPFTALDNEIIENAQGIFQQHLANGGLIVLTTHRALTQKNLVSQSLILPGHELVSS